MSLQITSEPVGFKTTRPTETQQAKRQQLSKHTGTCYDCPLHAQCRKDKQKCPFPSFFLKAFDYIFLWLLPEAHFPIILQFRVDQDPLGSLKELVGTYPTFHLKLASTIKPVFRFSREGEASHCLHIWCLNFYSCPTRGGLSIHLALTANRAQHSKSHRTILKKKISF